ncbi:MAG: DUF2192 domain-containing protein [Vulcanisaeta sp.]|jgi:hypothetical protein|uniref:DUF2192 domain-containing protein n=1 Tax=Vulcanisaeta moutnovskia (strain 768-28) TaxID=985053 RepID=F0QWY7_VULM7|nr:DUF2192 domain-containing protein [Vulcanisaeta moutnovskia]ADY01105.1 hypothetical protein VMUT_0895 [Vulcanisaeta moutnovskia 768-28]
MSNGLDAKQLYKSRIEAATEIWSKIMRNEVSTRNQLEELVYIVYKQKGIEPFRGLSKVRIYDKEIATIYIVGKYGLGIMDGELANALKGIFNVEIVCDDIYNFLKGRSFQLSNDNEIEQLKKMLDNEVLGPKIEERGFRLMRYIFTGTIMRFFPEDDLIGTYKALSTAFPDLATTFIRYIKFYVAFRVAEDIALGNIKKVEEKKIMKYAHCLRLNLTKCAPHDKLIREIALRVYRVPRKVLDRLFPNEDQRSFIPKAQ